MSIVQAHLACSMILFARRYRKQPIFHRPLWFALKMDRIRYVSAVNRKWKFVWWVEFRLICCCFKCLSTHVFDMLSFSGISRVVLRRLFSIIAFILSSSTSVGHAAHGASLKSKSPVRKRANQLTIYILSLGNTECSQVLSDICNGKFDIFYHNHLWNVLSFERYLCYLQWLEKCVSAKKWN